MYGANYLFTYKAGWEKAHESWKREKWHVKHGGKEQCSEETRIDMNYDDGEETGRARLEGHIMEGFENRIWPFVLYARDLTREVT